jgi:hypothetical protein
MSGLSGRVTTAASAAVVDGDGACVSGAVVAATWGGDASGSLVFESIKF